MKKLIKTSSVIFLQLILLLGIIMFHSCVNHGDAYDKKEVKINSISPNTASTNDVITIVGYGFNASRNNSFVYFNSIQASNYISWSEMEIKVRVPDGATSGIVYVSVNGTKSNEVNFNISNIQYGSTIDIDANVYKTIIIGSQTWMTENLRVSHYRNGDPIPQVTDRTLWSGLRKGAWCFYNNDPTLGAQYGKLYHGYTVLDSRGLAPTGWHIPSYDEWKILIDYLGGSSVAGGKLKVEGTSYWQNPNTGATNDLGFSALPGGYISYPGEFLSKGHSGSWWSTTRTEWTLLYGLNLIDYSEAASLFAFDSMIGLSVRCIKD